MDTLRAELGITLAEFEIGLFRELQKEFCDTLARVLKSIDDRILALRDSDRYEARELLERTPKNIAWANQFQETALSGYRNRQTCILNGREGHKEGTAARGLYASDESHSHRTDWQEPFRWYVLLC